MSHIIFYDTTASVGIKTIVSAIPENISVYLLSAGMAVKVDAVHTAFRADVAEEVVADLIIAVANGVPRSHSTTVDGVHHHIIEHIVFDLEVDTAAEVYARVTAVFENVMGDHGANVVLYLNTLTEVLG